EEYYTKKAKKEGYPARSVYKLKEIDETFGVIKEGDLVLDLGSAPGSWLSYISKKAGKVYGIDENETEIGGDNIVFIRKDINDESVLDMIRGLKFDSVVADLSPKTTGIRFLDSGLSLELSERAFFIAKKVLKEGGDFVCKIFESQESSDFIKSIGPSFKMIKRFRPKAVLRKSKEFYIVAKGFKKSKLTLGDCSESSFCVKVK
ncbi:MAG: hypothetical protein A2562_01160, partial [Candidatus Nealsonbacteria bacterium RIFOXYD1_FULL_39_11]